MGSGKVFGKDRGKAIAVKKYELKTTLQFRLQPEEVAALWYDRPLEERAWFWASCPREEVEEYLANCTPEEKAEYLEVFGD